MSMRFHDKNKVTIEDGDIVSDGSSHYRMCYDTPNGTYLLGGDSGYIHDLSQDLFNGIERIGSFAEHGHLLIVD